MVHEIEIYFTLFVRCQLFFPISGYAQKSGEIKEKDTPSFEACSTGPGGGTVFNKRCSLL